MSTDRSLHLKLDEPTLIKNNSHYQQRTFITNDGQTKLLRR